MICCISIITCNILDLKIETNSDISISPQAMTSSLFSPIPNTVNPQNNSQNNPQSVQSIEEGAKGVNNLNNSNNLTKSLSTKIIDGTTVTPKNKAFNDWVKVRS